MSSSTTPPALSPPGLRVTSNPAHVHRGDDGVVYPNWVGVEVTEPSAIPFDLTIRVDVVHGRPICRAIEVRQRPGGPPVGRASLGVIPVDVIVRNAVASRTLIPEHSNPTRFHPSSGNERQVIERRLRPQRGRVADPDERDRLVRRVAQMYIDLTDAGVTKPKRPIADTLGYSLSHVGTLLAEARRRGLVGKPPGPGRAGSVP